jgi:hypothetical protein
MNDATDAQVKAEYEKMIFAWNHLVSNQEALDIFGERAE